MLLRYLVLSCAWAVIPQWVAAQDSPGLVVPVPSSTEVRKSIQEFVTPKGTRAKIDIVRPLRAPAHVPVVVFVNVVGPDLRTWNSYQQWARLVTSKGLAGVLYEGPSFDRAKSPLENVAVANAYVDSVLSALHQHETSWGVDGSNVVLWAGSANTSSGTPVALEGKRPSIRGYILYYGAGSVGSVRLDVPVFIARAGLDAVGLNRQLDSLTARLVQSGVAVTLANYPGGRHAFDILDSTATTANIVAQTLEFAVTATSAAAQRALQTSVHEVQAAASFANGQWANAVAAYREVARQRPNAAGVLWRLGLAQLENGEPAAALSSLTRARDLGVSGPRDIGLPAARAALRAGDTSTAAKWIEWAISRFPRIRDEIAADAELKPLLDHPALKPSRSPQVES